MKRYAAGSHIGYHNPPESSGRRVPTARQTRREPPSLFTAIDGAVALSVLGALAYFAGYCFWTHVNVNSSYPKDLEAQPGYLDLMVVGAELLFTYAAILIFGYIALRWILSLGSGTAWTFVKETLDEEYRRHPIVTSFVAVAILMIMVTKLPAMIPLDELRSNDVYLVVDDLVLVDGPIFEYKRAQFIKRHDGMVVLRDQEGHRLVVINEDQISQMTLQTPEGIKAKQHGNESEGHQTGSSQSGSSVLDSNYSKDQQ